MSRLRAGTSLKTMILRLTAPAEDAKRVLLGEKEPSLQFTTPEELGALAVFFCSAAGNNVRGAAWNMDGGWAAQ
jgi:3-hydroxybutyrate dehydrogenase